MTDNVVEEPQFNDWQIKRLRYRLIVYLHHINVKFDERRTREHPGQTSEKGKAGRLAYSRPSFETVAQQINGTDDCQDWVWLEKHENGHFRPIKEASGYKNKNARSTTYITYQKLFLFVVGEDNKGATKKPLRKYTTPNGCSLMAILIFLKLKGFFSDIDNRKPKPVLSRERAQELFHQYDLQPTTLEDNVGFNGDYWASNQREYVEQSLSMHIQTEVEARYDFRKQGYNQSQFYEAKLVDRLSPNTVKATSIAIEEREAWGVFREHEYAAFIYRLSDRYSNALAICVVNAVQFGSIKLAHDDVLVTRKIVSLSDLVIHFSLQTYIHPAEQINLTLWQCNSAELFESALEDLEPLTRYNVFTKLLKKNL